MRSLRFISLALMVFTIIALAGIPSFAAKGGNNGTTLAAYKTIDICTVDENTWRYSGVISVWNQGAIDTTGLAIDDWIQTKQPGDQFYNFCHVTTFTPALHEVAAGTTQATADTYAYSIDCAPLDPLYIRNVANVTITNHSNYIGTPFGPSPKATWTGGQPGACALPLPGGGCTYTQGYWGSKPDIVWPGSYSRDATFYLSGQTWQQVMNTPVNVSQGYYQLAHQYIAAVLNQASGAYVPQGVQDTLNLADNWFNNNAPSACTANGSCGTQKDWAATLDLYNNGTYPGGPAHCAQ